MGMRQTPYGRTTLKSVTIPGPRASAPRRGRPIVETLLRLIGVAAPLVAPAITARTAAAGSVGVAATSDTA